MKGSLEDNWLALAICILWYDEINSEDALRLVNGTSNKKKMCNDITPEMVNQIRKICASPRFSNTSRLVKRFGISLEIIKEILSGYYG